MLVLGDLEVDTPPAGALAEVVDLLDRAAGTHGIERRGLLTGALIAAGGLAQGLADHAFRTRGVDAPDVAADAALRLTLQLARRGLGRADDVAGALAALRALPMPDVVRVRQPEGFAAYAVYPEAYAAAAGALPDGVGTVIGVRSVGTTLAAVVAAALDDREPRLLTVRPVGPPFARTVVVDPELAAKVRGDVAVVDEGPGLSGSSLAAVATWLEGLGVPLHRVHLLPSHAGAPGPRASAEVRRVWATSPRHVRTFDDVVAPVVAAWVADLVGPVRSVEDLSGGGWRRHRAGLGAAPVVAWQERRKLLVRTDDGAWLARFVGLGTTGLDRLTLAAALRGFVPEVVGWRHGLLVERWHVEAEVAHPDLDHVAAYLAARARLPARARGAPVPALVAMARHNLAEAGLPTDAVDGWDLDRLERRRRPVAHDGRLHRWEWLRAGGRVLKADALDHHAGHDVVGPQDLAWDVAGAEVELGLDPATLCAALAGRGVDVDPDLIGLCRLAYPAFQLGAYTMAAEAEADPAERARLQAEVDRYRSAAASDRFA